jgi:hypothetical protein
MNASDTQMWRNYCSWINTHICHLSPPPNLKQIARNPLGSSYSLPHVLEAASSSSSSSSLPITTVNLLHSSSSRLSIFSFNLMILKPQNLSSNSSRKTVTRRSNSWVLRRVEGVLGQKVGILFLVMYRKLHFNRTASTVALKEERRR